MVIAYLRVSTDKQQIENQKEAICQFANKNNITIDKWHLETASGTKLQNNRILGRILGRLNADDVLIVSEISRLSRRMLEVMAILNMCIEKRVTLYSIKEGFKFRDDFNSKIMGFAFGMSAEIERSLISARTKEALAYKKAQGMVLGRPVGSSKQMRELIDNTDAIKSMIKAKTPITKIANKFKVSRGTIYSFIKLQNLEPV